MVNNRKSSSPESDKAIQQVIDNLNRIPKDINSKVFVDDISKAIYDKLRKKISI